MMNSHLIRTNEFDSVIVQFFDSLIIKTELFNISNTIFEKVF